MYNMHFGVAALVKHYVNEYLKQYKFTTNALYP
jgi:hypothetical protein